MNQVRSAIVFANVMLGLLLFSCVAQVDAAPVVLSISPDAARPGDVLQVDGSGLKGTREVLFVSGTAIKPAKFKVVKDEQLEVIFPEYYRGAGSASIIVVGTGSVTVAMSDKMKTIDANSKHDASAPFLNVVKDGIVDQVHGITVVSEGGIVAKSHASPVCFVKRTGRLAEFHGSMIFHEPGAILGNEFKSMRTPPQLIPVQQITISPNVEPVVIKSPEKPQPFAKRPPILMSITPSTAKPGDVVVFQGRDFGPVSNIYFVDTTHGLIEAGFKATSESVLRVEIPQGAMRRQLLVVVNPAGAAVNISENPTPTPPTLDRQEAQRELTNSSLFLLDYVRTGQVRGTGGGSRIVVIDKGATMTSAGGSCVFLVRNGGRLSTKMGGGCIVFHESDATVPFAAGKESLPAGLRVIDVGKINFSHHQLNLDVVPRY